MSERLSPRPLGTIGGRTSVARSGVWGQDQPRDVEAPQLSHVFHARARTWAYLLSVGPPPWLLAFHTLLRSHGEGGRFAMLPLLLLKFDRQIGRLAASDRHGQLVGAG